METSRAARNQGSGKEPASGEPEVVTRFKRGEPFSDRQLANLVANREQMKHPTRQEMQLLVEDGDPHLITVRTRAEKTAAHYLGPGRVRMTRQFVVQRWSQFVGILESGGYDLPLDIPYYREELLEASRLNQLGEANFHLVCLAGASIREMYLGFSANPRGRYGFDEEKMTRLLTASEGGWYTENHASGYYLIDFTLREEASIAGKSETRERFPIQTLPLSAVAEATLLTRLLAEGRAAWRDDPVTPRTPNLEEDRNWVHCCLDTPVPIGGYHLCELGAGDEQKVQVALGGYHDRLELTTLNPWITHQAASGVITWYSPRAEYGIRNEHRSYGV